MPQTDAPLMRAWRQLYPLLERVADRQRVAIRTVLTAALAAISAGLLAALLSSPLGRYEVPPASTVFLPVTDSNDPLKALTPLMRELSTAGDSAGLTPDGSYWLMISTKLSAYQTQTVEIRHLRVKAALFTAYFDNGSPPIALSWRHEKGGVSLELPAGDRTVPSIRIVGRIDPAYPAVLKYFVWPTDRYLDSLSTFNRIGGALTGACLVVALTMGMLAWRNRDAVALMFGITVLLMLRIAAINHGWDLYWLGINRYSSAQSILLRITLPLYGAVQGLLFARLFKDALVKVKGAKYFNWTIASFFALAIAAPFVEHDVFLPIFWAWTPAGAAHLVYLLLRVLPQTKDRAARLYALALVVTVSGMVSELAFLAGIWSTTVSASLLGALLGATVSSAAIAERIYEDRAAALRAREREVKALRRLEESYQENPSALFEYSRDGSLKHANVEFHRMFPGLNEQYSSAKASHWNDTFYPPIDFAQLKSNQADGLFPEIALQTFSGPRYVDIRWTGDGDTVRGSVTDVTDQVHARQALQRLIDHDQLTGALNVLGLRSELDLQREHRTANHFLVLVDISRFSAINELFGHAVGDEVLRTVARRLSDQLTPPATLARLGADAFMILIPGDDIASASIVARDIAEYVTATPVTHEDRSVAISLCVGVVPITASMTLEDAIGASQRVVGRAKRQRSGSVSLVSERNETLYDYLSEKSLVERIAGKLPEHLMYQVLQPIINLRTPDGPYCAEALIRMRNDKGEEISAAKFIPAAERNGMMPEIDRWTIRNVCQWLESCNDRLPGLDYVTVNVSGASLNDLHFHRDVLAILNDHPHIARRLCFEITESVALADPNWTLKFTDQLRARECRIALDDFGAGYTSFRYLSSIPAEILKIDGAIIQSISTEQSSIAILRALRDLTTDLGMRCVAEYASDYETIRVLRELDIDFGQGYGLCPPVLPDKLMDIRGGLELIQVPLVARYLERATGVEFTVSGRTRVAAPKVRTKNRRSERNSARDTAR